MAADLAKSDCLERIAEAMGELFPAAANRPVHLRDSSYVWLVEGAAIDVFGAAITDDGMQSPLKHFVRLQPGQLAFGVDDNGHRLGFVAKGLKGAHLRRISLSAMLDAIAQSHQADAIAAELVVQCDSWIESLSNAVAREFETRPYTEQRLSPGNPIASGIASVDQNVLWVVGNNLDVTFLDLVDTVKGELGMAAVTRHTWIHLHSTQSVACRTSSEFEIGELVTVAMRKFHRAILEAETVHQRLLLADDANLQVEQVSLRRQAKAQARRRLANLSETGVDPEDDGSALEQALRMIGKYEGFQIKIPRIAGNTIPTLRDYCDASGLRVREVKLAAEDRWWLGDSCAMLAFRRKDDHPVVLIPRHAGRYQVVDAATGRSVDADARTAQDLYRACILYGGLKGHGSAGLRDLFQAASNHLAYDLTRLVSFGILGGVLALAPAVAVSVLIEEIIPSGDAATLMQFSAVLVGIALVTAFSFVLRGTALMRLEGRLTARLGSALWDRLLRLRLAFFRKYNAGELAARLNVFQDLRDYVSEVAAEAVLSTLFLLPAFALLFFFDPLLGLVFVILGMAALAVTAIFFVLHVDPQRRYMRTSHRMMGEIFQFLNGIAKVRTCGAEDSAFASWAEHYRKCKKSEIRLHFLSEHLSAFNAGLPAFVSALLFWVVAAQETGALTIANFLAVHTAAMIFCMSIIMLGNCAREVAFVKPACEQITPILASSPAGSSRSGKIHGLQGEILLDKVGYEFPDSGGRLLHDVSIHAKPGELVGIVGESGAGKTTILRIALGLEEPSSGAVYYDGKSLAQLDIATFRRQLGVVTQDSALQSGNILENIIGKGNALTVDDAWHAAHLAAIDEEIRAMPMGLYTSVDENSTTLSGGQCQRIRIAAALAHRPRIIFLDEPTSWLDAKTQTQALKGIEESAGTRIVIAHRLSTIRNADRIYVLQAGTVTQVGSFDELMAKQGLFRKLAKRQMV